MPQVPGVDRTTATATVVANTINHNNEIISDNQNKSTESSDSSIDEQKDSDEKEGKSRFDFVCSLIVEWLSVIETFFLY